jgi:hypothetical protein
MTEDFNKDLCEERHKHLQEWCEEIEIKIQKVSNRFLMLLTGLCLNLIGVIATLAILLMAKE